MSERLLFVVNDAAFFLSHRLPIALAARAAGYDVHVATPDGAAARRVEAHGFPWHGYPLERSGRHPVREMASVWSLAALYRRVRPDLVHHVTPKPVLYGTLAARACGVRAVVNAISGMGHVFAAPGRGMSVLRAGVGAGYALALRHPRMRVIFQNVDARDEFVRRRWIRAEEAVLIRGAGVDVAQFAPTPRDGRAVPLAVLPARMLRTKGVVEFAEAARRLRAEGVQARFALVGDPDPANPASVSEPLLREWEREGVVEYWGRREDMPAVLAEADVVCLPSYLEGLPKSLLEGAAAGLPLVTTDVPGCREVVRPEVDGLLVPPRDAASLARALRRLLEDAGLRARMGAAARARVESEFGLAQVVSAHLDLYRSLLAA